MRLHAADGVAVALDDEVVQSGEIEAVAFAVPAFVNNGRCGVVAVGADANDGLSQEIFCRFGEEVVQDGVKAGGCGGVVVALVAFLDGIGKQVDGGFVASAAAGGAFKAGHQVRPGLGGPTRPQALTELRFDGGIGQQLHGGFVGQPDHQGQQDDEIAVEDQ